MHATLSCAAPYKYAKRLVYGNPMVSYVSSTLRQDDTGHSTQNRPRPFNGNSE